MTDLQMIAPDSTDARLESARAFVKAVGELHPGEKAALRRNAGNTIAEARGALWFYRLLDEEGHKDREIYFLVATLMGLNKYPLTGNFGLTMAILNGKASQETTMERRFRILLDATFDGGEMAFRLRQLVKLAASKEVGVDWAQLLVDLRRWHWADKRVQKRWAQVFYAPASIDTTGESHG